MTDCIFCKIVNGDIPSAKVYENEHVLAFMDISQVTKGHTLVIPKVHKENIFELSPEIARKLYESVPAIASALKKEFNPQGLNTLNNNGAFADQSVFHFHLHLIPRYDESDGFKAKWVTHADEYSADELKQLADSISRHID